MNALFRTALLLFVTVHAFAQPAPIARQAGAPELNYRAVYDTLNLPANANFGATSSVAVNSRGNIIVLNRGPQPLMEFDASGKFIRAFGEGLFTRPHGLRIDAEDNIWATDGGEHVVYKFNPQGRIQMVLGVRGTAGEWHPVTPLRLFTEPNDIAIAANGDIYVTQGHGGKGENRVLRFDKNGNHLKSWGKRGSAPAAQNTLQFAFMQNRSIGNCTMIFVSRNVLRRTKQMLCLASTLRAVAGVCSSLKQANNSIHSVAAVSC